MKFLKLTVLDTLPTILSKLIDLVTTEYVNICKVKNFKFLILPSAVMCKEYQCIEYRIPHIRSVTKQKDP